ncbi:hypothetical protein [Sinomonas mesophila]|uniref:hypothetical protein n=1 Tax=Sinomonas mesophila TaxID=1531955 RepID=UPI000985A75F|nr:hypothetical protein [Sinomonas mesophila]
MAGSSVYGAGYHRGSEDGYNTGFSEGTVVGVVVGFGVSGVVALTAWGYPKVKKALTAKHRERLMESDPVPSGDDEAKEDSTD